MRVKKRTSKNWKKWWSKKVVVQKLTKIEKKWWAHTYKRLISTFEVVATELLFGLGVNSLKWNWIFFNRVHNFQSSGVSIRLLQKKKFFYNIVRHVMIRLWVTFKWFPMDRWSARSHLVTFSSKKKFTSNDCKPIRLLLKNLVYQYVYIHTLNYNIENFG